MVNEFLRVLDRSYWKGRKVFLTGHTGFKGSWLAYWLTTMEAKVFGYSLAPATEPSIFNLLRLDKLLHSHTVGDICDLDSLAQAFEKCNPEVVMHLAAQPIVSKGYVAPIETFNTNIMGVAHLLECCRQLKASVPVLIISSDKCYLNVDNDHAFQVNDPLGGFDPYSASKAGTEIVTASYRASFFGKDDIPKIASCRAGNVVGGGDWSADRLLPDCARAFSSGRTAKLRNPRAIRPWQHVLEPLYGYLILAQALAQDAAFARPWNFGPCEHHHLSAGQIAGMFRDSWGEAAEIRVSDENQAWKEASTLYLDCSETTHLLKFTPKLDIGMTIAMTARWYRNAYADMNYRSVRQLTEAQIYEYINLQECQ